MSHVSQSLVSSSASSSTSSSVAEPSKAPANPDKVISNARIIDYPHQLWFFIASFIALVACLQFISFLHGKYSRKNTRRTASSAVDPEASPNQTSTVHSHGQLQLRRLPIAIINTFRIIAFRTTLNIGQSYTLNLAEIAITIMYISALFTWGFINSMSFVSAFISAHYPNHAPFTATDTTGLKFAHRYWRNRAATLAASQLPLITVLGTKNNIVSRESTPLSQVL